MSRQTLLQNTLKSYRTVLEVPYLWYHHGKWIAVKQTSPVALPWDQTCVYLLKHLILITSYYQLIISIYLLFFLELTTPFLLHSPYYLVLLPSPYYPVITTQSLLSSHYYPVLTTQSLLPSPYYSVLTTQSLLPSPYYPVLTTQSLLPIHYYIDADSSDIFLLYVPSLILYKCCFILHVH